jgi:hypothetical protein
MPATVRRSTNHPSPDDAERAAGNADQETAMDELRQPPAGDGCFWIVAAGATLTRLLLRDPDSPKEKSSVALLTPARWLVVRETRSGVLVPSDARLSRKPSVGASRPWRSSSWQSCRPGAPPRSESFHAIAEGNGALRSGQKHKRASSHAVLRGLARAGQPSTAWPPCTRSGGDRRWGPRRRRSSPFASIQSCGDSC